MFGGDCFVLVKDRVKVKVEIIDSALESLNLVFG